MRTRHLLTANVLLGILALLALCTLSCTDQINYRMPSVAADEQLYVLDIWIDGAYEYPGWYVDLAWIHVGEDIENAYYTYTIKPFPEEGTGFMWTCPWEPPDGRTDFKLYDRGGNLIMWDTNILWFWNGSCWHAGIRVGGSGSTILETPPEYRRERS